MGYEAITGMRESVSAWMWKPKQHLAQRRNDFLVMPITGHWRTSVVEGFELIDHPVCVCMRVCFCVWPQPPSEISWNSLQWFIVQCRWSRQWISRHSFTLHWGRFSHIQLFLQTLGPVKMSLPWRWAAEEKERSASQQMRQRSSGSRETRCSAGLSGLLQPGTTGPGWSCCSPRPGWLLKPRHLEEQRWRAEVRGDDGSRRRNFAILH